MSLTWACTVRLPALKLAADAGEIGVVPGRRLLGSLGFWKVAFSGLDGGLDSHDCWHAACAGDVETYLVSDNLPVPNPILSPLSLAKNGQDEASVLVPPTREGSLPLAEKESAVEDSGENHLRRPQTLSTPNQLTVSFLALGAGHRRGPRSVPRSPTGGGHRAQCFLLAWTLSASSSALGLGTRLVPEAPLSVLPACESRQARLEVPAAPKGAVRQSWIVRRLQGLQGALPSLDTFWHDLLQTSRQLSLSRAASVQRSLYSGAQKNLKLTTLQSPLW